MAAARSDSPSAPTAHLSCVHHGAERGSESGQACEDGGYFYPAETDAGITVKETSVDSGFQVDLKEDFWIIKRNKLETKQPIPVSTSNILNIYPCLCLASFIKAWFALKNMLMYFGSDKFSF